MFSYIVDYLLAKIRSAVEHGHYNPTQLQPLIYA
jgi:hypothetical protein